MKKIDFSKKKRERVIEKLKNAVNDSEMVNRIVFFQNEISVTHGTKVVAITSPSHDEVATAFAHSFASVYAINGEKVLLIDANLYNPVLARLFDIKAEDKKVGSKKDWSLSSLSDSLDAIVFEQKTYPSTTYKEKVIQKIIKDNETKYDRFILIVPSVEEHKDIVLLSDVVESIVLVTIKDFTKRSEIYNAIQFFDENKLPLSKTLLLS